jgi:dUTP pyrophosphatase
MDKDYYDNILLYKQNAEATMPQKADEFSSGFDLYACLEEPLCISPGSIGLVPTGLNVSMPNDYEMQIRSRSGIAVKKQVFVLNSPGTVDVSFSVINRDEVKVILANLGKEDFIVNHGDRIAQAVFMKLPRVQLREVIDPSEWPTPRSDRKGGFGSTGV